MFKQGNYFRFPRNIRQDNILRIYHFVKLKYVVQHCIQICFKTCIPGASPELFFFHIFHAKMRLCVFGVVPALPCLTQIAHFKICRATRRAIGFTCEYFASTVISVPLGHWIVPEIMFDLCHTERGLVNH